MNNKDIIELFLQNSDVQKFINDNNWNHIYNSPNKYTSVNFLWDHPEMSENIIGNFTIMLIKLGINPLKHMKNVPEAYLGCCDYADNLNTTQFEIPDGVEIIDNCAFLECSGLESIIIPKSVKEIKAEAFTDSDLKEVIYKGNKEDWQKIKQDISNPFHNTQDDIIIVCLDGELYEHG